MLAIAQTPGAPSPPMAVNPCDMGALLRAAIEEAGLNPHQVAVRAGMAAPNVYRALQSPDTRPVVARRILAAVGMRLAVVPDEKPRGR